MTGNEIRNALHSGQRVYATSIVSPSPMWPSVVGGAGLDFVFLDTEHVPQDRTTLSWMCRLYAAAGMPPVVRIPSPDPFEACKVLDGGACGIIAPYVESADQVRAMVGATRLRPLKGARLAEALKDPDTLEPGLRAYLDERNANTILIVNIESVPAMEDLDAILDVPGLDAVLIGPHDLSCSLGIPEQFWSAEFNEAVEEIVTRARAKGVGAGVHFWADTKLEIQWAKAGANLMMHSSDVSILSQGLERELNELRTALGDETESDGGEEVIV
ncbi:MAG: aldolase [bacterium]|nr:aldolase [bacterium]